MEGLASTHAGYHVPSMAEKDRPGRESQSSSAPDPIGTGLLSRPAAAARERVTAPATMLPIDCACVCAGSNQHRTRLSGSAVGGTAPVWTVKVVPSGYS
jgi:hypothetical protein